MGEKSRSNLSGSSGSASPTGKSFHHSVKDPHSSSLTRLAVIGLRSSWVVALTHPLFAMWASPSRISYYVTLLHEYEGHRESESHSSLQHNHRSDIPLFFAVFCSLKSQETRSSPLSGEVNTRQWHKRRWGSWQPGQKLLTTSSMPVFSHGLKLRGLVNGDVNIPYICSAEYSFQKY